MVVTESSDDSLDVARGGGTKTESSLSLGDAGKPRGWLLYLLTPLPGLVRPGRAAHNPRF